MYLISTGKTTVLSDFTSLETKSKYDHANGETTDFQFYAQHNIFVEVNKKSGLELMRIKETEQKLQIQRVRKLNIDNVYSVACAKQSLEEMAVGLANGHVKLYNYKQGQFVHRFNADYMRHTVLFLDYNVSDEYISAVFENGLINIYGIKTKTKIETLNIDNNSTLARFHPSKRFNLAVASYKGAVTLYDIQAKRRIFYSTDSHAAPCRDLCMSSAAPATLISVGYDCVINIFDIRRKTKPLQITYCHPLSTVAMSDCGTYFCVGNLKGELATYDMRNTNAYLAVKKVHDCAVTRIAFVPSSTELNAASFSSTGNQTAVGPAAESSRVERMPSGGNGGTDLRKSIAANAIYTAESVNTPPTRSCRDSFCDFLDFHSNKNQEKMSSRFTMRRDSFDWESLTRKNSNDEQRGSLFQIGSGLSSIDSANNSVAVLTCDSFEGKMNSTDYINPNAPTTNIASVLRENSNLSNNTQAFSTKKDNIQEEHLQKTQTHDKSADSDKENPSIELQKFKSERNSTPNRYRESLSSNKQGEFTLSATTEVSKQIADLRYEMNTRFTQLESEMNYIAETTKWKMFTQNSNMWNNQNSITAEIRDALGILLQTDPFLNEFMRVKQENELLKAELIKLTKK